jgi:hypothetical protein
MGLVVAMFAVAFNSLLWLARAGLSPVVSAHLGSAAGWLITMVAPAALLAMAARLRASRQREFVLVAATSLAIAAMISGA